MEPLSQLVDINRYQIDALPYPNDPERPPLTGAPLSRARELCGQRRGRLCSELEWEHACRGGGLSVFATGEKLDEACNTQPSTCMSPFGVRAMGHHREWTDSHVPASSQNSGGYAVRGGPDVLSQRCAHRKAVTSPKGARDLTFRCCYGEPNSRPFPAIPSYPTFESAPNLRGPLALAIAHEQALAAQNDGLDLTALAAAQAKQALGDAATSIVFEQGPLLWSPQQGVRVALQAGSSRHGPFIVAFYPMPDGSMQYAGSLLLRGHAAPVALARSHHDGRVLWSSCYDCPGDRGRAYMGERGSVLFLPE